jgi:hypothetical protein
VLDQERSKKAAMRDIIQEEGLAGLSTTLFSDDITHHEELPLKSFMVGFCLFNSG